MEWYMKKNNKKQKLKKDKVEREEWMNEITIMKHFWFIMTLYIIDFEGRTAMQSEDSSCDWVSSGCNYYFCEGIWNKRTYKTLQCGWDWYGAKYWQVEGCK